MSERVTTKQVQSMIELVQGVAARNGFDRIDHSGSIYASLRVQGGYGTYWLEAFQPGETGTSYNPYPRGLKEIDMFLRGMYAGLDSPRHNQ